MGNYNDDLFNFMLECLKRYCELDPLCGTIKRIDELYQVFKEYLKEIGITDDSTAEEIFEVLLSTILDKIDPTRPKSREISALICEYCLKWSEMTIKKDGAPDKVVRPPYVLREDIKRATDEETTKDMERVAQSRKSEKTRGEYDYQYYRGEDIGKAHPDTIVNYLTKHCSSLNASDMRKKLEKLFVGADCTGFVSRAIEYVMEQKKWTSLIQFKTIGPIVDGLLTKDKLTLINLNKSSRLNNAASFFKFYMHDKTEAAHDHIYFKESGTVTYETQPIADHQSDMMMMGSRLIYRFKVNGEKVEWDRMNKDFNPGDEPRITSLLPGDIIAMANTEDFKSGFHIAIICYVGVDQDGPFFITADSSPLSPTKSINKINERGKSATYSILKSPDPQKYTETVDPNNLLMRENGDGVRYILHRDFGYFNLKKFLAFRRPYAFDLYYRDIIKGQPETLEDNNSPAANPASSAASNLASGSTSNIYTESDIVRRIVKWKGKCVDATVKDKSGTFADLSPACVGLAANNFLLENVLAIFNPTLSSYRIFNEIHISPGDRNLTIGCGNYANSSLAKMFLAMPDEAWKEFRTYVAEKLLGNSSYFSQYTQDYVVTAYLNGKIKSASDIKNATALGESLDYFFGRDLLNGKNYSEIKDSATLTNRYKYNGKSWTITNKKKSYLSLWADTVLLLASIDPKTKKPAKQYDVYPDYSDKRSKMACTKFINRKEDKSASPVCVRLFPGHENDNHKCEYWFYNILYEALLLKSVANWQHELWVKDYYEECAGHLITLGGSRSEQSILTGLVSWKSSGLTTTGKDKLPFALASDSPFAYWRNLGDKYYLKSATEVLVNNKQKGYSDKQHLIDECVKKYGELFTGLIIWAQFIMTKGKVRSRLRAMWDAYFNTDDFAKKYKDDKKTTFDVSHIKKVKLDVSTTSVVLTITVKKGAKLVHSYTFLDINKKNTTTP